MRKIQGFGMFFMVLMIGSAALAQNNSAKVVPSTADSGSYLRDQILLDAQMAGESDIYVLTDEVAGLAQSVATYAPMSETRAKQIIELGKKVEDTEKRVKATAAEAKRTARKVNPDALEPRGLAQDTWGKVKKTAEDVIIAAANAKKTDLDKLRKDCEGEIQEIRDWRVKIDNEMKNIRQEAAVAKAEQQAENQRLAAEDAKIRQEAAETKAEQAKTDGRQDGDISALQAKGSAQEIENGRTKAEIAAVKNELAGKAEVGLFTVAEGFFTAIGDPFGGLNMYALRVSGDYIIRKGGGRFAIGAGIGQTLEKDTEFFFDNRLRFGLNWAAYGQKWLTTWLFGNSYSSGMPYSSQYGMGGGVSLQGDFAVNEDVAIMVEIFAGPAYDWHETKLPVPPWIKPGQMYKKTELKGVLLPELGINAGVTF